MGWLWLLVLGAALLGALLALLAFPLEIAFDVERHDVTRGEVRWRWLFAHGRARFPAAEKRRRRARREKRAREEPRRARKRRRTRLRAALTTPGMPARAWRFAHDLLEAAKPRGLLVQARIGAGDPAETGRLWAVLGPLAALLSQVRAADLRLAPDFSRRGVLVDGRGLLVIVPLELVALALGFLLSPTTLRAGMRAVRGGRRAS